MTIHQRSSTTLTTAATVLPLSLNEVKDYLGIQDSDESEDPSLMGALRAATLSAERYTRRTFVTTTWTMWMDRFPGKPLPWWDGVRQLADTELTDLTESISIPKSPLISITSIKAHKQDGTTPTVTASNYIVDLASEPARVALKVAQTWPTDALRSINGVEVEFIAGYGPVGSDVPEDIRRALLIMISDFHENRSAAPAKFEKVGESSISRFDSAIEVSLPVQAQTLLSTYKLWKL